MVVGGPLVRRQLLPTILQRVHAHVLVKSQLINAVLAFYLPIVPWCCDPNTMVFNAHFYQSFLKQRFML